MPAHVIDRAEAGTRIVTLPRPSTDVVRLTLFVDAGSRDAEPVQTATLAAWTAAANGGPDIESTVYPDVTELALECSKQALTDCIDQLAHALATRDPAPAAISRMRLRLHEGQRAAIAREPLEGLDATALAALLGAEPARGFFPLGQPSDDVAQASERAAKFLRDHYGPARALLVAAGDAEPDRVREAVTASFSHLPRAALPRTARDLRPSAAPQLAVSFDTRSAVAVAIAGHDEAQLQAIVASAALALNRGEPRVELSGSVFATRGGAVALLHAHAHADDSELALDRLVRELSRLKLEPPSAAASHVEPDDLVSSSRSFGWKFGADGAALTQGFQFGAALQLEAASDAGPKGQNDAQKAQRNRAQHAQVSFARALTQAESRVRGDVDEYGASVVSENGVHIEVQFAQGDDVAIAVRIGSGAEQDPPLLHGQTAMLATLTSIACAGMGPELLRSRLAKLGASWEPRVDAESYGLAMRVPKQRWQDGLDLALRCMRAPSKQPQHFTDAAVELLSRLRKQSGALAYRARAGALISPRSPGQSAPWGDPARIGNITVRTLENAARESLAGSRWAVGIVGPVPVKDAVERSARRLSDLSAGSLPKRVASGEQASGLQADSPRTLTGNGVNVIAVWAVRGKFSAKLGARVFARGMAALLAAIPGIDVLWQEGDVQADSGFAALALHLRPNLAATLSQLLAATARSLDDRLLDKALEPAVARARDAQNAADAQVAVRAERLARIRIGAPLGEAKAGDALTLLTALRSATARWAVLP